MSPTATPTPIFVVGLQKSGTTVMRRLLAQTGLVGSPWTGEDDEFWGNVPPAAPAAFPAGAVYQRSEGARGHEIDAEDATPEVCSVLRDRLAALPTTPEPYVVNKNPYNTVRIPWLRAVFPESRIVAMVRRPEPNVFSLLKKEAMSERAAIGADDGWWGVKPAGWRSLRSPDPVERCARQWAAVNHKLHQDRELLDELVAYHALCSDPVPILERIIGRTIDRRLGSVQCLDDEYQRGAELRSKNRYGGRPGARQFGPQHGEPVEIEALEGTAVSMVATTCAETQRLYPELR